MADPQYRARQARLLAWWFVCIGVGFLLLSLRSVLAHDQLWRVAVRLVIAAGFLIYGLYSLRATAGR